MCLIFASLNPLGNIILKTICKQPMVDILVVFKFYGKKNTYFQISMKLIQYHVPTGCIIKWLTIKTIILTHCRYTSLRGKVVSYFSEISCASNDTTKTKMQKKINNDIVVSQTGRNSRWTDMWQKIKAYTYWTNQFPDKVLKR